VSVQRVWERDSRTVVVRWNLRCFPRILDNVMGTMVNLDGLSEYHFNDAGLVQVHKVCPFNKITKPLSATNHHGQTEQFSDLQMLLKLDCCEVCPCCSQDFETVHWTSTEVCCVLQVDVINWEDALNKKPARQLYRSLSTAGC
jgi:hypothetical protein